MKKLYFISIFVVLAGCFFLPGISTTTSNEFIVVGENLGSTFRINYKNCGGVCLEDSLGKVHYSEDILLFSPFKDCVSNDFDATESIYDYNNIGIKIYGFEKGNKLRVIVLEINKNTYDIIGEEYFRRLGPFGKNDFSDEEFATLLQRVDDYIDNHSGKWAKRASENDTVLILGNY